MRRKITSIAETVQAGYPLPADPIDVSEVLTIGDEAALKTILECYRTELYGIAAYFVNKSVDSFISSDIRQRFPNDAETMTPYDYRYELGAISARHLRLYLWPAINGALSGLEAEEEAAYQRLSNLCGLFRSFHRNGRYDTPSALIRAGAGTAADTIPEAMLDMYAFLKETEPDKSDSGVLEILRASSGIIKRVASVSVDHLEDAATVVMSMHNDSKYDVEPNYQLQEFPGAPARVRFRQPFNRFVVMGRRIESGPTVYSTLGCPALVHIGGRENPSAIEKLWDWQIDVLQNRVRLAV